MIFIHASYSLVAIPILSQLIFEKLKSKFAKFHGWGVEWSHRRRIDLEDKAKVVAYAWGAESLPR